MVKPGNVATLLKLAWLCESVLFRTLDLILRKIKRHDPDSQHLDPRHFENAGDLWLLRSFRFPAFPENTGNLWLREVAEGAIANLISNYRIYESMILS
jgi:hypothetical protein